MAYSFSDYLVIGISSRALFDLSKEHEIYEEEGLEAYSDFQIAHEDEPLEPGTGFPLAKAILGLNNLVPEKRKTEVVVMSRNSADTSLRIFRSIEHHGLDITRAALSGGTSIARYLNAYGVDLFLSAHDEDVQEAINAGVAAGRIYDPPKGSVAPSDQIRIAFDGDAVLFSEEAERIYQEEGLEAFLEHERASARKPLGEGPFAKLLRTISYLQNELQLPRPPIRTALVTARNSPAHERVIRTLREWNVRVDEAHFLGGAPKAPILSAFQAHIYFDDQDVHLKDTSVGVPVARVPYRTHPEVHLPVTPLTPDELKKIRKVDEGAPHEDESSLTGPVTPSAVPSDAQ